MEAAINLGRVVQAYTAIRDARTVKRHAWEAEDLALEQDQDKLKVLMLGILNSTGADSIRTEYGTAIRSLKVKPSAADWSAIYQWILADPDRFELLERRVKATFVKQYMEENGGAAPPGVNVHSEYEVSVRRPNNTASGGTPATSEE